MYKLLVLASAGSVFIGIVWGNPPDCHSPPARPAATTTGATAAPPGSGAIAARVALVPPKGPPVLLEAGKGTLIRLPRPAGTVFIAHPEVTDVQGKSPSLIH